MSETYQARGRLVSAPTIYDEGTTKERAVMRIIFNRYRKGEDVPQPRNVVAFGSYNTKRASEWGKGDEIEVLGHLDITPSSKKNDQGGTDTYFNVTVIADARIYRTAKVRPKTDGKTNEDDTGALENQSDIPADIPADVIDRLANENRGTDESPF